jgi:hypothetical protein
MHFFYLSISKTLAQTIKVILINFISKNFYYIKLSTKICCAVSRISNHPNVWSGDLGGKYVERDKAWWRLIGAGV